MLVKVLQFSLFSFLRFLLVSEAATFNEQAPFWELICHQLILKLFRNWRKVGQRLRNRVKESNQIICCQLKFSTLISNSFSLVLSHVAFQERQFSWAKRKFKNWWEEEMLKSITFKMLNLEPCASLNSLDNIPYLRPHARFKVLNYLKVFDKSSLKTLQGKLNNPKEIFRFTNIHFYWFKYTGCFFSLVPP